MEEKPIHNLIGYLLQHTKCMEIRLEYATAQTSQYQKHILKKATDKVKSALETIFTLFPDKASIEHSKKVLDRADIVNVMLITEELLKVPEEDIENIVDIINNYLDNKYGKREVQNNE